MARTLVLTFLGRVDADRGPIETPAPYALGHTIPLVVHDDPPTILGRRPDCDVLLDDPSVGQRAVSLVSREGGIWLDDLGGGGGSFLQRGAQRMDRPSGPLEPGDRLAIGSLLFAVALP